MKLVGDDQPAVELAPAPQRRVREHLRGAADDGCGRVHGRVAREEPDVFRSEIADELKEFLRHERLERRGVPRGVASRGRRRDRGGRDERLPAPRGRGQQDVVTLAELHDGLVLRVVQLDVFRLRRPLHDGFVERVGRSRVVAEVDDLPREASHGRGRGVDGVLSLREVLRAVDHEGRRRGGRRTRRRGRRWRCRRRASPSRADDGGSAARERGVARGER
eukprot:31327-Pelagococcus_subviridis.AAC.7